MRTFLALFVGAALFAGPAFSECCCDSGVRVGNDGRRVSTVSSDGYFMQNGKVMAFRNGQVTELNQEATLDDGSRIMTDGTIVLRDGNRRTLTNNQWFFGDGRFSESINADHRTTFNRDGYFRENGKTFMMRNGNRSEITSETMLDNGSKLMPDGTIVMKDGTRSNLRDGQRMAFDGSFRDQNQRPTEPNAQNASHDRFNQNNSADQKVNEADKILNSNRNSNPNPSANNNQQAPVSGQSNENHRDRNATQSTRETPPNTSNSTNNSNNSAGQVNENHRDRGATQDKTNTTNGQPTQGRNDQNKNEPNK